MKPYTRSRRPAAPPSPSAPPTSTAAVDLLAELDRFAVRAAVAPRLSVAVVADLSVALGDHLRDAADHLRARRPSRSPFATVGSLAAAIESRTWADDPRAVLTAADGALRRTIAPNDAEALQRKFQAERALSLCRAAVRSATRRLDLIAEREAARQRGHASGALRPISR